MSNEDRAVSTRLRMMSVRLPEYLFAAVEGVAEEADQSVSEVVRAALGRHTWTHLTEMHTQYALEAAPTLEELEEALTRQLEYVRKMNRLGELNERRLAEYLERMQSNRERFAQEMAETIASDVRKRAEQIELEEE